MIIQICKTARLTSTTVLKIRDGAWRNASSGHSCQRSNSSNLGWLTTHERIANMRSKACNYHCLEVKEYHDGNTK